MTILGDAKERMVAACVAGAAAVCRRISRGRWEFGSASGRVAGSAAVEDGWFLLRVPLNGEWDGTEDWSLLCRNASLGGMCKFVRDPFGLRRELRADLPLDSEDALESLPRRLRETLEEFESALGTNRGFPETTLSNDPPHPSTAFGVADLLQETGWTFVERSPVQFAVDLEVPGNFIQALVEDQGGCGITARVEAAKYDSLTPSQRSALAFFLLTTGGAVRMSRSAIVESETSIVARLEVNLNAPGPADLDHALSALSVASDLCVREARCLERGQLAEIYCRARCGPCVGAMQYPFNNPNYKGDGYGNNEPIGTHA